MDKTNSTEYTAIPPTAYPITVDTEEYQTAARSNPLVFPRVFPKLQSPYVHPTVQQHVKPNTVVALAIVPEPPKPPNHLVMSIFNLLCCCFLLGIIALMYSLKVDSEFAAGRYTEAERASKKARKINKAGIGLGICILVILISMMIMIVSLPFLLVGQ